MEYLILIIGVVIIMASIFKLIQKEKECNEMMDKCIEQNKRQSELLEEYAEEAKKLLDDNKHLTVELSKSYQTCESILNKYSLDLAQMRSTFANITEKIQLIEKILINSDDGCNSEVLKLAHMIEQELTEIEYDTDETTQAEFQQKLTFDMGGIV